MNMEEIKVYDASLGLDGTIPQLVDWANRYTNDYSDAALIKISNLAREYGLDEKYIKIPILLLNERDFENMGDDCRINAAYARLCVEHYLGNPISLAMSNFGQDGTELEIREEGDMVLISLIGMDDEGSWSAAGAWSIEEFISHDGDWLDKIIGEVYYYDKSYNE